jgi:hypothetical protein
MGRKSLIHRNLSGSRLEIFDNNGYEQRLLILNSNLKARRKAETAKSKQYGNVWLSESLKSRFSSLKRKLARKYGKVYMKAA